MDGPLLLRSDFSRITVSFTAEVEEEEEAICSMQLGSTCAAQAATTLGAWAVTSSKTWGPIQKRIVSSMSFSLTIARALPWEFLLK